MFLDKKYIYYILKLYIFFIRKLEACFPKEQILLAAPENGRDPKFSVLLGKNGGNIPFFPAFGAAESKSERIR